MLIYVRLKCIMRIEAIVDKVQLKISTVNKCKFLCVFTLCFSISFFVYLNDHKKMDNLTF